MKNTLIEAQIKKCVEEIQYKVAEFNESGYLGTDIIFLEKALMGFRTTICNQIIEELNEMIQDFDEAWATCFDYNDYNAATVLKNKVDVLKEFREKLSL